MQPLFFCIFSIIYLLITSVWTCFITLNNKDNPSQLKMSKITKILATRDVAKDESNNCSNEYPIVHFVQESNCRLDGEINCYNKGECKRNCGFLNKTHLYEIFICSCQLVR